MVEFKEKLFIAGTLGWLADRLRDIQIIHIVLKMAIVPASTIPGFAFISIHWRK